MLRIPSFSARLCTQLIRPNAIGVLTKSNSTAAKAAAQPSAKPAAADAPKKSTNRPTSTQTYTPKSPLVAAAFATLQESQLVRSKLETPKDDVGLSAEILHTISKANTVNGLLAISEAHGPASPELALKIISVLSEWIETNRVSPPAFENDMRFLRLCRKLGRQNTKAKSNANDSSNTPNYRSDDLNVVLGVAGEDEATALIARIKPPQMVKVLSALAQKKRRTVPLLQTLAFNIGSSVEPLNIKEASDVLYAMATLNFRDSLLVAKACADLQLALPSVEKSPLVASSVTSLGILRYRDLDILESITRWYLDNSDQARSQDIAAYFMTTGLLNFRSANSTEEIYAKLVKTLVPKDFSTSVEYLNFVWSLVLSEVADNASLATVLSPEFIDKLQAEVKEPLTAVYKLRLLNINAYVQHLAKQYDGPILPADSPIFDLQITQSKSKSELSKSILDALKSLLPSEKYVQASANLNLGFIIDAVCYFDEKRNPLPLNTQYENANKVAFMAVDYNDTCHGPNRCANGITTLSYNLLEALDYTVIPVPYSEFQANDKLLKRIQYLEKKLKSIN